jgi:hypothetical protein
MSLDVGDNPSGQIYHVLVRSPLGGEDGALARLLLRSRVRNAVQHACSNVNALLSIVSISETTIARTSTTVPAKGGEYESWSLGQVLI